MKTTAIKLDDFKRAGRMDCWYFLSPARDAIESLRGAEQLGAQSLKLGGPGGVASRVRHPKRFTRPLAAAGEPALPYIRPYDLFNYYPEATDSISRYRTKWLDDYKLKVGQILQTRSGRNLGPAIYVDAYLARFVTSDDMIRIEIPDTRLRHYTYAYLNSRVGRQMLRRDKTGSVIDHLYEGQVSEQDILLFGPDTIQAVAEKIENAITLREEARLTLWRMLEDYQATLPPLERQRRLSNGWTLRSSAFRGRLDAAFYDPLVEAIRMELSQAGGVPVAEVAEVRKPGTRYKTCYVEEDHGLPILSGRQLLQVDPINLKYIARGALKQVEAYSLHRDWIAYPADGRAEEALGTPVLVTGDREGWLASGHIGRIVPRPGIDPGWLFLALKTSHAQLQIKSMASGSVVDSTYCSDMEAVILPAATGVDGVVVRQLWEKFSKARSLEMEARKVLDALLASSQAEYSRSSNGGLVSATERIGSRRSVY